MTDATGFTDYPDQNENLGLCVNGNTTRIGGRGNSGPAENFDGYLAEFHFLDGTTKAYTDFGKFDDNGVWIPKQYTGGYYGNNGFYLEFNKQELVLIQAVLVLILVEKTIIFQFQVWWQQMLQQIHRS